MALALASAILAGSAQAATVSLTPVRTVPMGYTPTTNYSVASDGTIWLVRQISSGEDKIWHLDDEGHVLAEYPITTGVFYPLSIGYYGGRVYVARAGGIDAGLLSWPVAGIGTTTPVASDTETDERIGDLGFYFRIGSNGVATIAMGQANKVGTLDLNNVAGLHPFYGQEFMGAGISKPYNAGGNSFESCSYPAGGPGTGGGPPPSCGTNNGVSPRQNGSPGFDYAIDVAPGNDGLYVLEKDGDSVTHVFTGLGGPSPDLRFGSGGSGAGQMIEPFSIVRQANSGDLYVSDQGNLRIDVFSAGGAFIASFGYGVLDGADTFEACGVEIGPCRAGVSYNSDPRSYFSRLDLGPEGDLYAYSPVANEIQVFSLGETQGNPGAGSGNPAGGGNPGGTTGPSKQPLKCRKGFKKKRVHGKAKCAKVKHHKPRHKSH